MSNLRLVILLVLVGACAAPSGRIRDSVGEDSWETIDSIGIQLRLSKLDAAGAGDFAIARGDQVLGHGPAQAGTTVPVTLDGRACAVAVVGPYSYDASSERREPRHIRKRSGPDIASRTYRGVEVEVSCADGPVPGTAAGERGANPRRAMLWMLLPALLGVIGGAFARTDRKGGEQIGTATLVILAGLAAAGAIAWTLFDGGFRLAMTVVGVGAVILGTVGGRLHTRRRPHGAYAWLAGAAVGSLPLVFLSPGWSYGGPIAALACAVGGAVVASTIAVLAKPLV